MKKITILVLCITVFFSSSAFATTYLVQLGTVGAATWDASITGTVVNLAAVNAGNPASLNAWFADKILAIPTFSGTTLGSSDQIWIIKGTYSLTGSMGIKGGVKMYGGFAGTAGETVATRVKNSTDAWDFTNVTALDGSVGGVKTYIGLSGGSTTLGTLVDGLTIQNCHNVSTTSSGGGVKLFGAGTTLQNCIITACTSATGGTGASAGITLTGGATLKDSYIHHNTNASTAGGVSVYGNTCVVSGCKIDNNTATDGGGLYLYSNTSGVSISNCSFNSNSSTSAANGGAAIGSYVTVTNALPISIADCSFSSNTAVNSGGAIFLDVRAASTLNITRCTFTTNTSSAASTSAKGGGAIIANNCVLIIDKCSFTGNQSISGGGAVLLANTSTTLTASKFIGNSAAGSSGGSAIYCKTNYIANNCLFADNIGSTVLHFYAGAISSSFQNCTLANNLTSASAAASIQLLGLTPSYAFSNCLFYKVSGFSGQTPTLTNCAFDIAIPAGATFSKTGLSTADFMDASNVTIASRNYNLTTGSIAINAGTNLTNATSPITKDILDVARPQGSAFDMGAYEYKSPVLTFGTPTAVSKTYGDAVFTNAASSNLSTGTKTYNSASTGVATVNTSTGEVTIVSMGTSIITASIAAADTYSAETVSYTLTVGAASPNLAFATATSVSKNYGDAAFTNLATSSNSAGLISYESGNTGVATVNASTGEVTIVSTGSAVITARLTAAGNYTSATTTYTLNVAAKALEVTGVASTKTYDDNTSSAGTPTVGALASGDVVNLAPTQTYDNNNYGINHVLTPSGLTIKDGSDADKTANYNITYTPSPATGVINKLALTIGAATIASKVYDGSANSGTVTAGTLSGFVGSETVTVNTAIGTYPDANVGTGKSATIVYTLANGTNGGLAANYSLANGSATGTITAATLTLNNAATIFKASDYTIADLANSDLVVSAGEFNADRATNAVQSVTVAPRAKLTLNSSKTLTTGSLTLQSDATGTGTFVDENTDGGLTVTGTASVQQWLTGKTGTSTRGLWYISSPVSAATAAVFDVAFVSPNKNNMTRYDETVPGYVTQFSDNATALTPGVGYVTQIGGADAAYTFSTSTGSNTAKLNTGEVTIPVTRTGTSAGKRGFNLVGNPYPSYLDWKNAGNTKDNLRSTIWYRVYTGSTMTFDTYDGTTGTNNNNNGAVTQYIAPMQAFWVKVNADNDVATLKFVNAARSNTDITRPTNKLKAPAQKTTEPQIVRLRVSNGTNSDEAILVADANATDAFDTYDAEKMSNDNSAIPEIYTLADSQELVINHLNDFAINKQVALGFRPGTNNTFSIVANEVSNVDAQTKVILIDKLQNNTEFDLTNGTAYTFSADATPTADRFVIAFRAPGVATNLSNANNVNIFVYKNANNQITINQNSAEVGIVTVCNAIGQKLVSMPTTGTITVIRKSFGSGVYFVTVNTAGSKSTQKIIIN